MDAKGVWHLRAAFAAYRCALVLGLGGFSAFSRPALGLLWPQAYALWRWPLLFLGSTLEAVLKIYSAGHKPPISCGPLLTYKVRVAKVLEESALSGSAERP